MLNKFINPYYFILRFLSFFYTWLVKFRSDSVGTLRVNKYSYIAWKSLIASDNLNFNGMTIKGYGKVYIGANFHSGECCKILTSSHNWRGNMVPYDRSHIISDVQIGNNVWLGDSVLLLPGTKLGDCVIVQAGSVVHGVVPDYSIIGGNPAVVFAKRDVDKTDHLISEGRFH